MGYLDDDEYLLLTDRKTGPRSFDSSRTSQRTETGKLEKRRLRGPYGQEADRPI